jgi:hypothetical protein
MDISGKTKERKTKNNIGDGGKTQVINERK